MGYGIRELYGVEAFRYGRGFVILTPSSRRNGGCIRDKV